MFAYKQSLEPKNNSIKWHKKISHQARSCQGEVLAPNRDKVFVAGIANPVTIFVCLRCIDIFQTVVASIANTVTVGVCLVSIGDCFTVVGVNIQYAVVVIIAVTGIATVIHSIRIRLFRVGNSWAVIYIINYAVIVSILELCRAVKPCPICIAARGVDTRINDVA